MLGVWGWLSRDSSSGFVTLVIPYFLFRLIVLLFVYKYLVSILNSLKSASEEITEDSQK
jgi:hypothetical protein